MDTITTWGRVGGKVHAYRDGELIDTIEGNRLSDVALECISVLQNGGAFFVLYADKYPAWTIPRDKVPQLMLDCVTAMRDGGLDKID